MKTFSPLIYITFSASIVDLRQVDGFSLGTSVSSTKKTDRQDIAEILLKVALNTITLTLTLTPASVLHNLKKV